MIASLLKVCEAREVIFDASINTCPSRLADTLTNHVLRRLCCNRDVDIVDSNCDIAKIISLQERAVGGEVCHPMLLSSLRSTLWPVVYGGRRACLLVIRPTKQRFNIHVCLLLLEWRLLSLLFHTLPTVYLVELGEQDFLIVLHHLRFVDAGDC